ncbi:hypothetical protein B5S28_g1731 [[Candida] boidinii]|nr:hypothetical protein B5S28_g1731 [[Candida] boidinii]OWB59347.1 hypothetical protein B5S29_g203 [[Candida] boidinii]OWB72462.1 hypothetical protein B5S31_g2174 [[Candida] boidinii]OWB77517.1 hypothetical protein B5S32_g1685 [[Candida] boidinii]
MTIATEDSKNYNACIEAKRASLLEKIPAEWRLDSLKEKLPTDSENVNVFLDSVLPESENKITIQSASDLAPKIAKGELSAYDVTYAYCHRAALVQQLCNCCTEIFFDIALKRAKQLDEYYKETGKVVGPLHGIPISLKDQINLKGIDTGIGYVAPYLEDKTFQSIICDRKIENIKDESNKGEPESQIAKILYNAGAVFYVKTTVPMAMLGGETSSNIFGHTKNSLNRSLVCGGSSGGEGSLLGARGSVCGLGTDIGGSIRIPSMAQGLFGLRASSNRFTYLNISNSYPDQTVVCSVVGPMCRFVEDVELISKTIIDAEAWKVDAKVPPIPWREPSIKPTDKLNFGILKWDNVVMPHPPILRGIELVKNSLKSKGHEVIEFEKPPIPHGPLCSLLTSIYAADALEEIKNYCEMSGEPLNELLVRSFTSPKDKLKVDEFWDQAKLKYKYQQAYDEFFENTANLTSNGEPIVAQIIPAWNSTAWKHKDNMKTAGFYTRFLNILDYTVLTIPVTQADKSIDLKDENYKPTSAMDENNYNYYDPELYDSMPVVLQIVCRRYEEEKAIKLAKIIQESLKN